MSMQNIWNRICAKITLYVQICMITNVIFEFFMHAVWSNRMPDIWRDNNKWKMIKKPALLVIQRKKKNERNIPALQRLIGDELKF